MTEQHTTQPWAGFWRRVGAFVFDGLLIGIAGYLLGAAAYDVFAGIGQWARMVGLLIAMLYFGLFGSRLGGGQTLGKRLLKLRVTNQSGDSLSLGQAMVRAFVLVLPIILNGVALRSDGGPFTYGFAVLAATVLFGLGLAQLYLLVFNRPSRRLVHDLLIGSVVLKADASAAVAPVAAVHRRVALGIVVGVFILIAGLNLYFAQSKSGLIASLKSPLHAVEALPEVMTANVGENTSVMVTAKTGKTTSHTMVINARLKTWPRDPNTEAVRVARAALVVHRPKPGQGITVVLRYGFELGIASGWRSYVRSFPPPKPSIPQ